MVHTYKGHNAEVHLLQPFGDHVISVDRDNVVVIWDVQSEGTTNLEMFTFPPLFMVIVKSPATTIV